MKKILISTALLASMFTYAGGFRVSLQGVKQLAMAHTSAHAEDASVAFFNPAGISFIPNKLSVAMGGFGVKSTVTYQNLNTLQSYDTNSPMGTPIYAAITYRPVEPLTLGFSFSTPFGSTIQWDDNWAGKEIVQKMELKGFYFQPMASVKLAKWASVGASFIYVKGMVDWTKAVTQVGGTMNLNDETAHGSGYGLGVYLRPTEKLDVSIAYRSKVDMEAKKGTATFNVPSALYTGLGLAATSGGKDGFKATLPLVDEYTVGVTYKVTPKWQVSADFNYHGWSKYDKLTLDFANATVGNQTDKTVLTNPKNFKDTKTFRIGTQYMITNTIAGRLGFYHDESPYADEDFIPETPSFNNNVITGGLGFKFNKVGIDVSGAYTMMQSRAVNNAYYNFYGQAKSKAFYFGVGLSYNPF